jgi:hypothetical protein
MRRTLFTIVASFAVFAIGAASALAHGHPARHHHNHARTRTFGSFNDPSPATSTSPAALATVTAFDPTSGKLVITLSDGTTTETGIVTPDTEIECQGSSQQMGQNDIAGDGGGDDQGEDQGGQNCPTSMLVPGTTQVAAASLHFDSTGAVWDRIELAASSTTSPVPTGSGDDDGQGGDD